MDNRRRQYAAIDAYFAHSTTCERLLDAFGIAGPAAWLMLILYAKRAPDHGTILYTSETEFWMFVGVPPDQAPDLDAFLTLLGQLRQTRQTRFGRGLNRVTITNFDEWQTLPGRARDAARKRAQRAASPEHDTADNRADDTTPIDRTTNRRNPAREGEGEGDSKSRPLHNADGAGREPPPQQAAAARATIETKALAYVTGPGSEVPPSHLPADLTERYPSLDHEAIQRLLAAHTPPVENPDDEPGPL